MGRAGVLDKQNTGMFQDVSEFRVIFKKGEIENIFKGSIFIVLKVFESTSFQVIKQSISVA